MSKNSVTQLSRKGAKTYPHIYSKKEDSFVILKFFILQETGEIQAPSCHINLLYPMPRVTILESSFPSTFVSSLVFSFWRITKEKKIQQYVQRSLYIFLKKYRRINLLFFPLILGGFQNAMCKRNLLPIRHSGHVHSPFVLQKKRNWRKKEKRGSQRLYFLSPFFLTMGNYLLALCE